VPGGEQDGVRRPLSQIGRPGGEPDRVRLPVQELLVGSDDLHLLGFGALEQSEGDVLARQPIGQEWLPGCQPDHIRRPVQDSSIDAGEPLHWVAALGRIIGIGAK
jgi:hypothetical protein